MAQIAAKALASADSSKQRVQERTPTFSKLLRKGGDMKNNSCFSYRQRLALLKEILWITLLVLRIAVVLVVLFRL